MRLQKSWYAAPSRLLTCLSAPYSFIHVFLFIICAALKSLRLQQISCQLVVVTNVTVGGNGKTPTVLWLAQYLSQLGRQVAVISSGYKSQLNGTVLVSPGDDSKKVGDEALMLAKRLPGVDVYVGDHSRRVIEYVSGTQQYDVCISDGGFTELASLASTILWLDDSLAQGNGCVCPFGPLKYPAFFELFGIKLTKNTQSKTQPGFMYDDPYITDASDKKVSLPSGNIHLMTAVAKPEQVRATLRQCGVIEFTEEAFMDHAHFELPAASEGRYLVITEKDWARLRFIKRSDLRILRFDYQMNASGKNLLASLFE